MIKSLLKKQWFLGTLMISLLLIVFLINLWIMSLRLKTPYADDTIFSLAADISSGGYVRIFSFVLMIVFYVSILPLLMAGFSLLKKNNWGLLVGLTYLLGFDTTLIVFQSSFNYLTVFSVVLIILAILFTITALVLFIFRSRSLKLNQSVEITQKDQALASTKIPLIVLIINIVSIAIFLTTFFIPLYSLEVAGSPYHAIAINVLIFGDATIEMIVYFLVNFAILLAMLLYFAHCLTYYFFDKERFITKSNIFIMFAFIATISFFLVGLAMNMYYTLDGVTAQTVAFIPMLLMCVVIFIFAIFKGKFNAYRQLVYVDKKIGYAKIEPLLYVVLLTAITVATLLITIIDIQIIVNTITYSVELTGITILRDYPELDPGYRIVAYLLVVMLISVGLSLVVALSSYLSKHRHLSAIIKFATIVNILFVFIIAISGYYFQIAHAINTSVLIDIFAIYGIGIPDLIDFEYTIGTDAIYILIASVALLILMFVRKAFDRDEMGLVDAQALANNGSNGLGNNQESSGIDEDELYRIFDPCPALTDLDAKKEMFEQDLAKRKPLKATKSSLNELVHFVVEYARNSRLHLSYTPEDIATFVAGLGASRLSILQGMSGTGKTSLPKIFSEAILGNCDIVEVESSWKDKHELLGYYNEFSMKYTPKKFTLALYKAALNPEITTFILLDEMNLSRIEYYFSDFLSLMENEEHQREIKLINIRLSRKEEDQEVDYLALDHGNTLKVPPNVWFIGTANRDESTFVISDKVYDRAHTMNFTKRAPKVRNYTNPIPQTYYDYHMINGMFKAAKEQGSFDAENNELIKSVEVLLAPYNISFGNRILKQIEDFVNIYKACFLDDDVESEAIEKILLSKVVAKLEVKTIDDKEKLEMAFEKLNLMQCVEFIKHLDNE